MATSTLSTIRSSVKDVSYRPPGTKLNLLNKAKAYLIKGGLALNLQRAVNWVGLNGISLCKDPYSLSGEYKRRLALAIQLFKVPDMLVLDEPLVGLAAWADIIKLLKRLEKKLTILVVSHDLKELATLVDHPWRMEWVDF
ncbi:hypothetical protein Peur_038390 [Populus x canadensis]